MVKVNFKSTPLNADPGKETTEQKPPEREAKSRSSPRKEDIDLSFDSTESFFPRADEEPAEETTDHAFPEKPEKPQEERDQAESDTFTFKEPETVYKSSKKKYYIFLGALAGLLIIALFIIMLFLGRSGKEGAETIPKKAAEPAETVPERTTVQEELVPIYQTNEASNRFIEVQLQDFITRKPTSAEYSLIVITPEEINLTVLADSRDQIARFHVDLKRAFPDLAFRILSVQSRLMNGKEMIYADLNSPILPASISPASAVNTSSPPPQNLKNTMKTLAKRNNCNLEYFQEGKVLDHGPYSETLYYMNMNGKKEDIAGFLTNLSNSYPMVRIKKFSVYPYNLGTISDRNLYSRMSLSYYKSQ